MSKSTVSELTTAAAKARRDGDIERAVGHLQAALARAPNDPVALNSLGLISLEAGELAEARSSFELAINADPSSPELWMNLAKVHRLSGDYAMEADGLECEMLRGMFQEMIDYGLDEGASFNDQ